ncbi:type VI secretion system tip protein TssI/VgrG [Pseudomonas sp. MDT1-85]
MFAPANAAHFTLVIPTVRNDFKVLAFEGTETISSLYSIHIDLVSEYPDFDLESLLSQPAFLQFGLNGEGIHGRIEEVFAGEIGKRLTRYQLTLVPALHYLQFSHDQRIFQRQTVPQIIAQILNGHGIQADAYTFHVRTSPERKYCTQYGENDFEFIQRLCAEDGIAWHHQHSREGHLLVFTDDQTCFPKLGETPYQQDSGMVAEHPVVSQFSLRFSTRPSMTTHRHYDLKRPSLLLESRFTAEFTPELEDYRYPLFFESEKRGKQLARQALERHRADYQLAEGKSDQSTLRSGHFFDLTEHSRKTYNDLWLLLSVTHSGKQPQVLEESVTSAVEPEDGFTQGYRNRFSAIPWDVFYRPPMPPRKPVLVCQTARVTGPVGEEIYCDEYGRVKVEFHWDRTERNSEHSSCWLRVSSSWAGEGFGAVTIPRIGMEVVVTYLEGNPDQPLITGCVPNKVTPVPYPLPENKTKTVLRSHSSPSTGGYNELSIEDRAGQELIYLRAQRDLEQKVVNDSRLEVGNEHRVTIKGDCITVLGAEEHLTVMSDRKIQVNANNYLNVSGDSHTRVDKTLTVEAGEHVHIKAGAHLVIDGGESLSIKVGDQYIVLNADGIFSSSAIEVGGAPVPGMAAHTLLQSAAAGLLVSVAPAVPPSEENESDELEEEEEEVEEEGITLRIGVFFDGTGNNRSNSEMVAGCYARDVNLEEEAEDIRQFCQKYGYDGKGSAPDNSYGNDTSNVVKLYDLYSDDRNRQLAAEETIGYIPVYLEGIGTSSGEEDSLYSQATGVAAQGVLARVEQCPALILDRIRRFERVNPDRKIARIEFDIFGFSRGAAAARHFANEVLKGEESLLAALLPANESLFMEVFSWRTNTDVSINFIGIFDTAAAVASMADGDFSVHDANNPGVNLYLAPDIAKKIVHLVARDERRHNFSLNSAGAADIVLPGAHSDLGGGYLPRIFERVLLSKPHRSEENVRLPSTESSSYRAAQFELVRLQDQLNLYGLPLEVQTWAVEFSSSAKGDKNKWKHVYAAINCWREVRNDLALIYLRIMRELAAKHDVPFAFIDAEDQKYALPVELQPIAKKLMAYALGETRRAGLSLAEEELLVQRYIHLSANWNATRGNNSDLNIVFINRPAENHKRVVHPNV